MAAVVVSDSLPMLAQCLCQSIVTRSPTCRPRTVPMSVYHHNREPLGNRLSESPRRLPLRSWRVRRSRNHRPGLELLECRLVLSPTIFTVNSTGSGASGSGQSGTLPYVISQANVNANTAGSEIEFDSSVFSSPQTITLGATLVLSETAGPEVIDGPGAGLVTVSGGGMVSVFEINNGVTATLSGLTISDEARATAAGGGLYQTTGATTLTDCTISEAVTPPRAMAAAWKTMARPH